MSIHSNSMEKSNQHIIQSDFLLHFTEERKLEWHEGE